MSASLSAVAGSFDDLANLSVRKATAVAFASLFVTRVAEDGAEAQAADLPALS